MSLTVAVTGPTGDIGRAFLQALESEPRVDRVLGMARSPFDPLSIGAGKTEYRQGDITRREDVDALVTEAAVEVAAHVIARLPFAPAEAQWINAVREPVLMDTSRARQALKWHPRHAARDTLRATVEAARARGLV